MTKKAGLEFEAEKLLPCPFCGKSDMLREMDECENILVDCQRCEASAWKDRWQTRATPQPIDAWRPIETYDYEKFPQVILAGFITPSEYAQSNGSKPFWEISIGRCWHVNTRKFTGFLGQQPTHWMPLPKPPEDR